jgi:hypothetical protein
MNMGSTTVGLDKIETLDAISGTVLGTLEGEALAQMLRLNGGAKGTELLAGGSGVVFMDVTLDKDAAIPKTLKHRFKIAVAKTPSPDRGGDREPAPELPQEISFVGDPLDVGAPAVVVSPPLKGERWTVAGGCCNSYHRRATLAINGAIHVAQRYAIDFVQLNDKNMLYSVLRISFRAMPFSATRSTRLPTALSCRSQMAFLNRCLASCLKARRFK